MKLVAGAHDALSRIFADSHPQAYSMGDVWLHAVRGGHAGFQLAVRVEGGDCDLKVKTTSLAQGGTRLAIPEVFHLGMVKMEVNSYYNYRDGKRAGINHAYAGEVVRLVPFEMAEVLEPYAPLTIRNLRTEAFYVRVSVPKDAKAGTYEGRVIIQAGDQRTDVCYSVTVYPVNIPERPSIRVTNWFSARVLAKRYGAALLSPDYWRLIRKLARLAAEHRQDTVITPLCFGTLQDPPLIMPVQKGERICFDFSNFDRWVKLFFSEGYCLIEGGHLGGRLDQGWTSQFGLSAYTVFNPDGTVNRKVEKKPIEDPESEAFLSQFLPALNEHLTARGWKERYCQHIFDEPIDQNVDSYIAGERLMRRYFPGVRTIDAIHTPKAADSLDIQVPQMDYWNQNMDLFKAQQKAGRDVWFYTCCHPMGSYPNRYLDYPLIKTRILHWYNFVYGATGYLHWGLTYWNEQDPDVIATDPEWLLQPGDNWIVAPGTKGPLSSMRFENMRDGLEDYELLAMLAGRRRGKATATRLAGELVRGFTDHVLDPKVFHDVRRRLIETLSREMPLNGVLL